MDGEGAVIFLCELLPIYLEPHFGGFCTFSLLLRRYNKNELEEDRANVSLKERINYVYHDI